MKLEGLSSGKLHGLVTKLCADLVHLEPLLGGCNTAW
jgi:hypothetical protein